MKTSIALLLCLCQSVFATTWYVRPGVWTTVDGSGHPIPTAAVYGAQDGTSYADAWNGLTSIVWGGGGVSSGDTLYVCGTHVYRIFVNAGSLTSQAVSTIGTSSFTMRYDYPSDPGTLFGGNVNFLGAGAPYQGPDSNGVWFQVLNSSLTVPPTFYTNGLVRLKQRTNSTWTDGLGGQFKVGTTNYVQIPGGIGPTTNNMAQANAGWAFNFNNQTNISIIGGNVGTIVSGFSGANDFYAFRFGIPTAPFTTAPKDITWKDLIVRDTKSFYIYPGSDRWIFGGNNWGPAGDGPYSLINAQTNAPQQLTFTNNFFHDMDTAEYPSVDGHGIGIQGGSNHLLDHNSLSNTGPAILLWTGNVAMTNNTIRYNFIQKTHINSQGVSDGIGISGDNSLAAPGLRIGNKVYGNIIEDCAVGGGATYQGVGIGSNSPDYTEYYNNTITRANVGFDLEVAQAGQRVNAKVVNNIISDVNRYFYIVAPVAPNNLEVDYQVYSPAGFPSTLSPSIAHDTHSVTNNPRFVITPPTAQSDFYLQSISPAINAGVSAGYNPDIVGTPVLTGQYNIGAYQFTGCDFFSVSNAIVNANEGDTIEICAGSFTWLGPVTLNNNKSFRIKGAGTNLTFITSAAIPFGLKIQSNSTNVFTVDDMTIISDPANDSGFFLTGGNPPGTPMAGPCHFYNIDFPSSSARGIWMGFNDSFGLIEYCHAVIPLGASGWNPFVAGGNEYRSWTNANPLGTTNVVCVENCWVENNSGNNGNGFFDAYNGAQLTWRHNLMGGVQSGSGTANTGAHGYDSQVTSCRTGEIYANTFTNVNQTTALLDWRGGTLLWFSNTVYAASVVPENIRPLLKYYRACDGAYQGTVGYAGFPKTNTYTTNWADGETVRIGNQPDYTFKATLDNVNRHVKLGANLAASISNLTSCINLDPAGSGTLYAAITTTSANGRNLDFLPIAFDGTSITLTNILDGTGAFGYPASQQHGVINVTQYTNSPIVQYPCYGWANTVNGTNIGFGLAFIGSDCNGENHVADILQSGRDYFDDGTMPPGYTPLVFPHPLSAYPVGPTPPTPIGFSFFPGIKRKGF